LPPLKQVLIESIIFWKCRNWARANISFDDVWMYGWSPEIL